MSEVLLIDLRSLSFPIWSVSQEDPDTLATATKVIARIRALASGHEYVAVCDDCGPLVRKEIDPQYKAGRATTPAQYYHNLDIVRETLTRDGFPVLASPGHEADDVIATLCRQLPSEHEALIVSSDKDLSALVNERVRLMSAQRGEVNDAAAIEAKYQVRPDQMTDFLCLVGDTSDNVKGAHKIGAKTAAALLRNHGSLDALYAKLDEDGYLGAGVSVTIGESLTEFRARLPIVRQLITLRDDLEVSIDDVLKERKPQGGELQMSEDSRTSEPTFVDLVGDAMKDTLDGLRGHASDQVPRPVTLDVKPMPVERGASPGVATALAVRPAEVLAPGDFERALEPRSMQEAVQLAKMMFASRLFSAYGTEAGVLATILAGRELGMQALASLRAFHLIDGKPTMYADLIRALVIQSRRAKYLRCAERDAKRATFVTQRADDGQPETSLTYTIDEGRLQISGGNEWTPAMEEKWRKSGWGRNPNDMLVARAGVKLARLVYPEVIHGLYAREEFDNGGI